MEVDVAAHAYKLHLSLEDAPPISAIDEAIECYEHAVELASRESAAKIYVNLGSLLKRKGLYQKALEAYENALARDKKSSTTHFNIGNLRYQMQDYGLAEDAFNKSISLDPSNFKPRVSYGWLLQGQGRFKEAKMYYLEALELERDNFVAQANIHANLGLIYHEIFAEDGHRSSCDDAEYHYLIALELDKDQKEATECLPLLDDRDTVAFFNKLGDYFPEKKKKKKPLKLSIVLLLFLFSFFFIFSKTKIPF